MCIRDRHNIVEVPAEEYHELTDKDMLIYYISEDKEVTFKRSNRELPENDTGVYGILRDAHA